MSELIYHDPLDHTGISPFDKAIHDITEGEEVLIACPYIDPSYLKDVVGNTSNWSLLTDIGEWLGIHGQMNREAVQEFLTGHRNRVRHVPDLHAKVVIGSDQAIIGSANLTKKGLTRRTEMAVLLEERDTIDELIDWFETLWSIYNPPEIDRVEAYIESASDTPSPAQTHSDVTFPSEQLPGKASLSESHISDAVKETESDIGQVDLVKKDSYLPSPGSEEMPPIPNVTEFKTKTDQNYYNQLISENENQVNLMRHIIREQGEITKGGLKEELKKRRDVTISGSFDADLRVLWRSTEEVAPKNPRGDEAVLRWIGE